MDSEHPTDSIEAEGFDSNMLRTHHQKHVLLAAAQPLLDGLEPFRQLNVPPIGIAVYSPNGINQTHLLFDSRIFLLRQFLRIVLLFSVSHKVENGRNLQDASIEPAAFVAHRFGENAQKLLLHFLVGQELLNNLHRPMLLRQRVSRYDVDARVLSADIRHPLGLRDCIGRALEDKGREGR